MIRIYPAESRGHRDHGWLKANFSFSFADYYDPDNTGFGPLLVFNDDVIKPGRGFGMHPHREMEIVTVVLKGELEHRDSMGNTERIIPGQIQRMSAGTGLMHSEMNPSPDKEVNLLQLWFEPAQRRLEPSYEMVGYDPQAMAGKLLPIVSGSLPETPGVGRIHQDLTIYLSRLNAGGSVRFTQQPDRRTYLFVIEGEAALNAEHRFGRRDAVRATELTDVRVTSEAGATFMLIDLP